MAIDATVTDIVQEINDARVDMQSFASFMFEPANVMITRRLAPDTHSLQHYLDYLDAIKLVFTQESGDVTVGDRTIKTVQQSIGDAVETILKSGGRVGYPTLAAATADKANIAAKTVVEITNDTTANNGIYLYNGTTFTKSSYDVVAIAKAYTDSKITELKEKSSGTFDTLAQLNLTELVDGSFALVANDSDATKNGYYKKVGGAWTKTGFQPLSQAKSYTDQKSSETLIAAQNEIYEFADSFLEPSANLLGFTDLILNKTISPSGSLDDNTSYNVHPYIRVEPNSQYVLSAESIYAARYMPYYDANKKFLGRMATTLDSSTNQLVITMPANAHYVRFVVDSGNNYTPSKKPMFTKGAVKIPYEPKKNPDLVNVDINNLIPFDGIEQRIETISADKIYEFTDTFLKSNYNLLRLSGFIEDTTIDPRTGSLVANDGYHVHPYIRVEPDTDYLLTANNIYAAQFMAYYDKDKKFLGRSGTQLNTDTNSLIVRTTADTYYVRFVLNKLSYSPRNKPMFVKGTERLPYIIGKDLLHSVDFADGVRDKIRDVVKPFRYDLPVTNVFNAPSGYTQYADVNQDMSNADVYAKWDALVAAYPEYVSKQYLGQSTDDYEVSCYKFKAQRFNNTIITPVDTGYRDKYPTIFITLGLHGQEPVSVFTGYALAHQLCTNWQSNEALEALRFNADIIFIPITNPSGRATRNRKSTSGTDIGRNFPSSGWEQYANVPPTENTYAGPYPASEPETRYVMQVFEENDVDIYYDFHNFAATETGQEYFLWVLCNGETQFRMERMSRMLFGRMSRKWYKDYDWVPANWQVGYSQKVTGGLPYNYAAEVAKVPLCGTIEMSLTIPLQQPPGDRFDETHSKMLVESIVNWLLINLQEINAK